MFRKMISKRLTKEEWEQIEKLIKNNQLSILEIARTYGISRNSIYVKAIKENWIKKKKDKGFLNKLKNLFK